MSGLRIPVETKPAQKQLRDLQGRFIKAGNASVKAQSQMKGFRGAMGKMGKGLKGLARGLTSFKALLIGVAGAAGLGMLGKSFLNAATTTEGFQLRLQTLLGSAAAGNQMFKEMAEFASKVPFEFEMIMESATNLSGVMKGGIDEVTQWMPMIADLAAATGMPIEEATEQIQRMYSAGAASADKFREKGVLAMLGFTAGVSYSDEETREMLMNAWKDP
ncbi:MAG: hypothetical protein KAS39_02430, partial [Actinomycetia bacterium]|nr:hypothetical protein [Actinomycetes bacterium]